MCNSSKPPKPKPVVNPTPLPAPEPIAAVAEPARKKRTDTKVGGRGGLTIERAPVGGGFTGGSGLTIAQ